ncbi:MAG: flavin reductase family protein [Geminicoccaceae bacterium]
MTRLLSARAPVHCGDGVESSSAFIDAMATVATPVSIVTTEGPVGRFGITVSAVVSVSAEPPIVLVCINRKSPAVAAIDGNGVFCVNMLGADQSPLADCFAGRPDDGEAFDFGRGDWREAASGAPVLDSATASFDCTFERGWDAGTHRIVTGRVLRACCSERQPLAYSRRAYRILRPLQDGLASTQNNQQAG